MESLFNALFGAGLFAIGLPIVKCGFEKGFVDGSIEVLFGLLLSFVGLIIIVGMLTT